MITDELLDYIKEERKDGVSDDEIKQTLKDEGGWTDDDLKEAFDELGEPEKAAGAASSAQPSGSQTKKKTAASSKSQQSSANTQKQTKAKQGGSKSTSKKTADTKKNSSAASTKKKSASSKKQASQAAKQRQKAADAESSLKKVVGVIVAVLLVAVVGLGAAYVYITGTLPFAIGGMNHTQVAQEAIASIADNGDGLQRSSVVSTREYAGDSGTTRIVSTALNATDTAQYALEVEGARVSAGTTTGSLSAGLTYTDDTLFLNVGRRSEQLQGPLLGGLSTLAGAGWVRFDESSATGTATSSSETATSTAEADQAADGLRQYARTQVTQQGTHLQKLFSLYAADDSLAVEKSSETTLRQTPVYRYTLSSDNFASTVDAYMQYMDGQLAETFLLSRVAPANQVYTPELSGAQAGEAATSTEYTAEIWVSKKENTLLKHTLRAERGEASAAIVTELGIDDAVSTPSDAVPFAELGSATSSDATEQ